MCTNCLSIIIYLLHYCKNKTGLLLHPIFQIRERAFAQGTQENTTDHSQLYFTIENIRVDVTKLAKDLFPLLNQSVTYFSLTWRIIILALDVLPLAKSLSCLSYFCCGVESSRSFRSQATVENVQHTPSQSLLEQAYCETISKSQQSWPQAVLGNNVFPKEGRQ